jgi:tRNA threonylcarbamoyladenosine biosynthesis protein TsaB
MLTLAVTSSTAAVGVAVGVAGASGAQVAHRHLTTDRRHSEELTPLIQATLADAGVTMSHLDLLVADIGPGRFTGLRVGLATIRTLALALDRPVAGISSLDALLRAEVGPDGTDRPVAAVIDARRAEVFQQWVDIDGTRTEPVVGDPAKLAAELPSGSTVVGDGADRYTEHYGHGVLPGREPSAAIMVAAAATLTPVPGREVRPLYLRDADVNVNVKTRHTPR